MAKKFLRNVNGTIVEVIGVDSSTGVANAGDIVALDSNGLIPLNMMPTGIGPDLKNLVASENLSAGDLVNIWYDVSIQKVRKADASNGRRAVGFVKAPVLSGASVDVYLETTISGLSGLTPGLPMFLGTTGQATATAPTTSGYISQEIGIAISATEISFEPQQPITLA